MKAQAKIRLHKFCMAFMISNSKMIKFLLLVFIGVLFNNCQENQRVTTNKIYNVSSQDQHASAAYLTQNHNGVPVLVWTAYYTDKKNSVQYFSIFNEETDSFGKPVEIPTSRGTTPHAESMNKVAWKSDGTIVSVFEKKHPHKANQWAGSIMYSTSVDEGTTWTPPTPIHTDTSSQYSRSFFDVATLPNGEVGVIWLDGRHGKGHMSGSTLYLSHTTDSHKFITEREIIRGTCECCRTVLHVSDEGIVNVLFRNIFDESIRDMALLRSNDNGKTFPNEAIHVHDDNWVIDACPHTGPTMGTNNGVSSIAWVTGGSTKGLLYTTIDSTDVIQKPILISSTGKNPQVDVSETGITGLVWVEQFDSSGVLHFQLRDGISKKTQIEFGFEQVPNAAYPVVLSHNSSWVVAWTQKLESNSAVKYTIIKT